MGSEHREEVVDRRAVSTTQQARNRQSQESRTEVGVDMKTQTHTHTHTHTRTHTHTNVIKEGDNWKHEIERDKTGREKGRKKSSMSKCGFIEPMVSVCQALGRK